MDRDYIQGRMPVNIASNGTMPGVPAPGPEAGTGQRTGIVPQTYRDGMNDFERLAKRLFDIIGALCCLAVFSPIMLAVAILIVMDDGAPVLYHQERVGKGGRSFTIHKFRSMKRDAETFGPALCAGSADGRLTKTGEFLRAHHLDELPQLWNVLKGDMSFVGPRPERPYYVEKITERDSRYRFLYQVRPGITSSATLHNGYARDMDGMLRRLQYDLHDLNTHSLVSDMSVLCRTFLSIMLGKRF